MSFTVVNVFVFTHDVRRLRAIADPAPALPPQRRERRFSYEEGGTGEVVAWECAQCDYVNELGEQFCARCNNARIDVGIDVRDEEDGVDSDDDSSDDDDEEGWPAPPTASDDGGRGPAYSFDVDEPPPKRPPPKRGDKWEALFAV